jgi:AcrR family transcriptional regulator
MPRVTSAAKRAPAAKRATAGKSSAANESSAGAVVEYGRHRGARRMRLDATSWVDAGIQILVRESIEHVRIERIAVQLGVTKGSFYWHFKDRADLHAAILDRWLQKATIGVKDRVEREYSTASERLLRLFELPFWSPNAARSADLELAIRAWSRRSPLAKRAVSKVDGVRLDYLASLYRDMKFSAEEATVRAHLAYSFMRYLGQLHDVPEEEERRIIQDGYRCLVAAG